MLDHTPQQRTEVVETIYGPVVGLENDGIRRFLGMPYAAPPVGKLRWREPVPPSKWEQDFEAFNYGNVCAQNNRCWLGFGHSGGSEDCLYINVVAPASSVENQDKRPVMVWFHGGGLIIGACNSYDATWLVKEGNVVFVSMNYRLNIFGFFSHPAINTEGHASGNYGFMDQQMALRWVRDNIEAFGGDASNVTIFGESAGGISVCAHMVSSASKGLFHKAICQSGGVPVATQLLTLEELQEDGEAFAAKAGCENQTAAELRRLSTEEAMAVNAVPKGGYALGAFRFWLMEDGHILPKGIPETFGSGQINAVPTLMGINRDEYYWFAGMLELATGSQVAVDHYSQAVKDTFTRQPPAGFPLTVVPEDCVDEIVSRYPPTSFENPSQALASAIGDSGFVNVAGRQAARTLCKTAPVLYAYEFDVPDSPAPWPKVSYSYRSCHALELQFLFPGFPVGAEDGPQPAPLTKPQQRLAEQMVQYWTSFAKDGTPNGQTTYSGTKMPTWEQYTADRDNVMILEAPIPRLTNGWGRRHHCDFWDVHYNAK